MAPRPGPKSCTKSRVARLQTSLRLMYPEMYFFSPPPLNPPLGFESSSKRRFARKVCGCGVCNGSAPQALRRHCDGAHVTLIKTHAYAHIHLSRKWRGWRSVFFFFFSCLQTAADFLLSFGLVKNMKPQRTIWKLVQSRWWMNHLFLGGLHMPENSIVFAMGAFCVRISQTLWVQGIIISKDPSLF